MHRHAFIAHPVVITVTAGDGETGSGVEIDGQLRYANSVIGFTVEGSARVLLGHSGDYEEWGIQGTIAKQVGRDGQGLAFHLTPAYGDVDSGVEELLAQGLSDDENNATDPDYHMNQTKPNQIFNRPYSANNPTKTLTLKTAFGYKDRLTSN